MDYPDPAADVTTPHMPMLRARYSQSPARRLPRRSISLLASLPAVLVPPVVFGGLLFSLWTYKVSRAMPSVPD